MKTIIFSKNNHYFFLFLFDNRMKKILFHLYLKIFWKSITQQIKYTKRHTPITVNDNSVKILLFVNLNILFFLIYYFF
jgi:hypothetical protein